MRGKLSAKLCKRAFVAIGLLSGLTLPGLADPLSPLAPKVFEKGVQLCQEGSPAGPLWLAQAVSLDPGNKNYRTAFGSYLSHCPRLLDALDIERSFTDGKLLVNASQARSVASGKKLFAYDFEEDLARVEFAETGQCFATIGEYGLVQVWSSRDGQAVGPQYREVTAAALDSDGQRLALAFRNGTAKVFQVADGKPLSPPLECPDDILSLRFANTSAELLGGYSQGICLWDRAGQLVFKREIEGRPELLRFHSDDTRFLVISNDSWNSKETSGGDVLLFEKASGAPIGHAMTHDGRILDARWSPDGRTISTFSEDGIARVWSGESGRPRFHQRLCRESSGFDQATASVCYSEDGESVLFSTSWATRVLSLETGQWLYPGLEGANCAVFLGSDKVLTTGDEQARFWKLSPVRSQSAWRGPVHHSGWTQQGRAVWSQEHDVIRLRDPHTGDPVGKPLNCPGMRAVALHPDGTQAAIEEGSEVRIWEVSSAEPLSQPVPTGYGLRSMAYSPDGSFLVTVEDELVVRDPKAGIEKVELERVHDSVHAIAFSPDGTLIAGASLMGGVYVWELRTGKKLAIDIGHADGESVAQLVFTRDSRRLLSAAEDGLAILWDLESGKAVTTVEQLWGLSAADYSPAGHSFATLGGDGLCRVWGADGTPLSMPWEVPLGLEATAYDPSGDLLAIARSGDVRVYDPTTGLALTPPLTGGASPADGFGATWQPWGANGKQLLTSNEQGCWVWNLCGDEDEPADLSLLTASVWTGQQLERDGQLLHLPDWNDHRERWESHAADHAHTCAFPDSNLYSATR